MISKKKRELIIHRDNEICVACGSRNELTIHHRVNRGAGGSKLFDGFEYLLTVCNPCNVGFESDAFSAQEARRLGYKLSRNASPAVDATQIPIYYLSANKWYHLDIKGNKRENNE